VKICFFVRLKDPALFELVTFYRVDIELLRSLGHEVVCVHRLRDLLITSCDLYFVWWFGFGFFPVVMGRILGKSSLLTGAVHTADGGGLDDWPWRKRILMKCAMRWADCTLFISSADRQRLGQFRPRRSGVVYCALDRENYIKTGNPKREIVASVTHLTKENVKRKMLLESLDVFAEFVKTHPIYQFHICGSFGDGVEEVRERCRTLGIESNVTLRGRVTEVEKMELLREASIYLQPSLCEGFGVAILEAQASGTPVVTNRESCIDEICGNSVVYGSNIVEMSAAMGRLVSEVDYYSEMRRRGLINVQQYSVEARRRAINELIIELIGHYEFEGR
jgi:glycosyltransferase involved in cell wall biosynthesis